MIKLLKLSLSRKKKKKKKLKVKEKVQKSISIINFEKCVNFKYILFVLFRIYLSLKL